MPNREEKGCVDADKEWASVECWSEEAVRARRRLWRARRREGRGRRQDRLRRLTAKQSGMRSLELCALMRARSAWISRGGLTWLPSILSARLETRTPRASVTMASTPWSPNGNLWLPQRNGRSEKIICFYVFVVSYISQQSPHISQQGFHNDSSKNNTKTTKFLQELLCHCCVLKVANHTHM